jgi:hypothetical protein
MITAYQIHIKTIWILWWLYMVLALKGLEESSYDSYFFCWKALTPYLGTQIN